MIETFVFVYGSLKKGSYNHNLLLNSEFISQHITEQKYTMVDIGMYPAVIQSGNTAICGEIYKVEKNVLRALDELEGFPDYYDRILTPTKFGESWMYILPNNSENYTVLPSGQWDI